MASKPDLTKVTRTQCFRCGQPDLTLYFENEHMVGVRCSECDLLAVVLDSLTNANELQDIGEESQRNHWISPYLATLLLATVSAAVGLIGGLMLT